MDPRRRINRTIQRDELFASRFTTPPVLTTHRCSGQFEAFRIWEVYKMQDGLSDIIEFRPEQVETVVHFHLRPYYRDEGGTDDLSYSEATNSTTAFHAYWVFSGDPLYSPYRLSTACI